LRVTAGVRDRRRCYGLFQRHADALREGGGIMGKHIDQGSKAVVEVIDKIINMVATVN
jgi:hypothetical protein